VGKGQIDWQGQLKALVSDGYPGFLVIETHCAPKEESFLRKTAFLSSMKPLS